MWIEPAAELVEHCLSAWCWQECTTAVPVFSLSQCLQRANKSRYRFTVNIIKFPVFNFAQVLPPSVLELPGNNDFKTAKKRVSKSIFQKKICLNWEFWISYLMLESQLLGHMGAVVFNEMLLSFVFNPLQSAERTLHELAVINLNAGNGFMVSSSWYVNVSSSRKVIGVTDKERGLYQ